MDYELDEDDYEPPPVADPETGEVRLMADKCTTCIYRPKGERLELGDERLREFKASARGGHVVCHSTLDLPKAAICRGSASPTRLPPMVQYAADLGLAHVVQVTEEDLKRSGKTTESDRA